MNRHLIDYNAAPSPYVAMTDPAKTPSQIAAELEEQRRQAQAADAKAYAKMTPPAGAKPREAPYSPEGFDFAYVDRKGHQGEVIKGRPEPASLVDAAHSESIITPLAPSAAVVPVGVIPEGATHVQVLGFRGEPMGADLAGKMFYRRGSDGFADSNHTASWHRSGWKNSELDGPHFRPLAPSSAAPTAIEVMEACRHLDNDTWDRLIREFGMSPGRAYHEMPESKRAEFIRRCNALRPESTQ